MKEGCPFQYIKRKPDYQSTAPGILPSIKVESKELFSNGYGQKIHCKCTVCGQKVVVEGNHNPYYEAWIWPEQAACEKI